MELDNGRMRIMVIDDADIIRHSLKKFLSEYDLEVVTCNDGLEGLQKAVEYKPKLIFLDLLMPNLDGIRMLRVLKVMEELKRIPVIVISGHTDKANVLAAMEAGADRIISKPLTKEMLIRNINDVLGSNFLSNSKRLTSLTMVEKEDLSKELKKYFMSSLAHKKETLKQSLEIKNKDLLKLIVHELKGSAGTVGFSHISDLCREVELVIVSPYSTWKEIQEKSKELLDAFEEIESTILK